MTPAERAAKIAELRAEADRLEREGKRNWPEKVERGMLFQANSTATWMALDDRFVCVRGSEPNSSAIGVSMIMDLDEMARFDMTYLGHARDLLTIKTPDAPEPTEPTGAELAGKACMVGDYEGVWAGPQIIKEFHPKRGYRWSSLWYKFARLAKERP